MRYFARLQMKCEMKREIGRRQPVPYSSSCSIFPCERKLLFEFGKSPPFYTRHWVVCARKYFINRFVDGTPGMRESLR